MKFVIFQSLVLAMVMASAPAAAGESTIAQTASAAGATRVGQWGPRHEGRWIQGWRAPGGWGAYRPAVRGWVLPGYWMAPRYYIGNYTRYGWSTPPAGHGWSRYYDDAVLTDRDGRVYETVHNVDWDKYDQAESGAAQAAPAPRNAKGEVVGAVAGGASERRGNASWANGANAIPVTKAAGQARGAAATMAGPSRFMKAASKANIVDRTRTGAVTMSPDTAPAPRLLPRRLINR